MRALAEQCKAWRSLHFSCGIPQASLKTLINHEKYPLLQDISSGKCSTLIPYFITWYWLIFFFFSIDYWIALGQFLFLFPLKSAELTSFFPLEVPNVIQVKHLLLLPLNFNSGALHLTLHALLQTSYSVGLDTCLTENILTSLECNWDW